MAEKGTVLIEVSVDTEKVSAKLGEATRRVMELKDENSKLQKEQKALAEQIRKEGDATGELTRKMAENAKTIALNSGEIEANNRVIKSSTALVQMQTLAQIDSNATLDEQRQLLNAAQKAFASMSEEEKEAAGGAEHLQQQINALNDRVKEQEEAMGDHRRNVGNYTESIIEASEKLGGFGGGLTAVLNPIKSVTMGLKAMSATPIIAILGLLVQILMKLAEKFKGNAAAMEKLTELFGVFSGAANIVNKIVDKIAEGLGWLAEKALEMAEKLGILTADMKAGQEIAKEDIAIQKEQQRVALANAESQKKIAKLKADATETDKYSAKQRLDMLQQAADEEEAIAQRQYDLAKREYELQVKKNAQSESSMEDLKKENDLHVAMINAETDLFNKKKELNGQMAALRTQLSADGKKSNEELIAQTEEAAAKLEEIRQTIASRARTALENELLDLKAKEEEELAIVGLTEEEKQSIREYYEGERTRMKQEQAALDAAAETQRLEAIQAAREEFGLEPGMTEEEQAMLRAKQAFDQGLLNEEEYQQAKANIEDKFREEKEKKEKEAAEELRKQYRENLKAAVASASGAANELAGAFGEFAAESEAAAAAQKAFTLIGILTNQAQAISEGALAVAKGVSSAAALPFPTNIPAIISVTAQIGSMVAGVMSSIAQAKKLFDTANTQKFAQGGLVDGTSYTGDNVLVRADAGEMMINRKDQTQLFNYLTGRGGTLGMDYEMLAMAVAALPAPVMDYTEFKQFEQEVSTYNEIAKV